MHSIVLAATGYALLLSSFITLAFLLRKGCSKKNKSPFYILSTSDVFSAILTAIVLLVNHIEAGIRLTYNWQNNTLNDIPNRTWTIEEEENSQFPFLQIRNLREADLDVTLTCDMKGLFMQYGILLAALTNAFVSLMTLTIQCNLTVSCVKQRCADIMGSLVKDIQPKDVKVTQREEKIPEDGQEAVFQRQDNTDNVKNGSSFLRGIMKIFKFRISKGDKPAKFFVTSHWLVPFLVVAILYLAEYDDMSAIRYTEDTECVFDSNFPMNDFYIVSDVEDNLKIADSIIYTTPVGNKYLEELSSKIKPSSAEVDEIVLKVQKIVKSALNYTGNYSENTKNNFLASSGSQSMADYVAANNITNYIKNNMNIDHVTERPDDTLTGQNASIHDASSYNGTDFNRDPSQASLFHDLLKNSSEELDVATFGSPSEVHDTLDKDDGYGQNAQMYPAEENQKTVNITIVQNKTSVSNNNQIYNNIMKRIQAAIKNHNRTINHAKWRDSEDHVAKRKPNSIKNLFSSKSDDFNRYINTEMRNGTRHMINECLVSTKFLQLYLFVLFFAIYFLSILLSSILQMRGKHMCESTRAILRAKTHLASTLLRNNSSEDHNTTIIDESPCLSMDNKGNRYHNSTEGSNTSQEAREQDCSSRSDIEAIKEDRDKSDGEMKDESLLLEIDCVVRIFNTIKLSLILCIVLWTPIFSGTLLRVLLCIRAPQWLIDTTFLSASSFGIVRNILNMYIIKIQEICSDAKTKNNRIHPVK
ncbi:unnamed protein product [Lasius platythorax]|uniref:G-protein coupled receptors family 1 profile domain-containing protein n=1 Tax=Lasius platythorax TaxID=488582 RepID=A0AAV2NHA7_9HYME